MICQDLSQLGVTIIPPESSDYEHRAADILKRLQSRPKGGPPLREGSYSIDSKASAVLLNEAPKAIVSLSHIWHFRAANHRDRVVTKSFTPGVSHSVLLPFGMDERRRKWSLYWHTIFPGSKRILRPGGPMLGDNTDVKLPSGDEVWEGGFIGSSGRRHDKNIEPVKLVLDSIFFEDGGFAGPDTLGMWQRTLAALETYLEVGAMARKALHSSVPPTESFGRISSLVGQHEEPSSRRYLATVQSSIAPDGLDRERRAIGSRITGLRRRLGDIVALQEISKWNSETTPRLHKI